ncbi:MAG: NAD(P)H-binding protein [Pseudomonadota bacterium]|nr:NAD(P)H-binding protein [Pseudomonadota bacterium]
MTDRRTALVLGATGGVGGAIASALGRHGWTVKALVRDPSKAPASWGAKDFPPTWMQGDAMCRAEVIAAAQGGDAIVHAVNPPGYRNWDRLVLPMMANTIAAAKAARARIVLPGTIYNFDPAKVSLIDAGSPQMPRTRKGAIRVRMERMLEDAAPVAPSLIVRAGDFFGPGARSSWFAQGLVKPGRPIQRLLNPGTSAGHSWAYLPDLAETFAQLMDMGERLAPFERVQFEGYYDSDGSGMIEAIRRAAGRHVPERRFPWWLMRLLSPFGGFPREVVEIEQHWRHPVKLDNRRVVELLGGEPRTPLDQAVPTALIALGCLDEPARADREPSR